MGLISSLTNFLSGGANKRMDKLSAPIEKYSGYRPPNVSYLRPVEDQLAQILLERSRAEGVGFDPARREKLLENFEIEQDRDMEDQTADIKNRLSGMGLSRNVAANEELLGRALKEAGREKNLYRNRIDIEDMARANEERDVNTARLQDFNSFNFGQQNRVADFDLDVYSKETGNELARRGLAMNSEAYRESPLSVGLGIADAVASFKGGGSPGGNPALQTPAPTPVYTNSPTQRYTSAYGNGQDPMMQLLLQKSGKNLSR